MNSKKTNHQYVSAFDLFGKSYEVVMRNLKSFAVLLALPFVASLISSLHYGFSATTFDKWKHFNFFGSTAPAAPVIGLFGAGIFLLFLVITVVSLIIQTMLYGLELEGASGKTPSLKHLFDVGKKYWLRLLGLFLMIGLYVIGLSLIGMIIAVIFHRGIGIFIGLIWVLAAAFFVIQRYFLSPYVLIDQDLPVLDAMEHSANLAKNHAGAIWSVIGVSILLGLTGIIPILGPLISFALGALYSVAPALRYEELKKFA